ncbi:MULTISPECIES: GbsR/MarR family transcriptional regulator [Virgibacillus]|uniref:HTH-type transcriptional regulator n=1 Tax=Virgibacillus kapii TaxID=1638645 RepID=A0ABQ2DS09_9BACI|nr:MULTISPECIES: MarR family transcriptional regulator [Virgibacillus]EQB35120.1 hypothetical protein M948_18655 [Virgibacillus sp. CM-4]MYL42822.1 MarR family transcriptional regulator [Virgibacillus massiliensis]GGJ69695.1 hypothetical protein GCM10007111_34260 [Virgibacillus kapii]
MNRPQKETIINEIMLELSKTVEMFGLTPLESRLFAYLYLTEKPMTLDDMADALGKSKTSMSTSIRALSDQNLVTRVWRKGVRKDLYEANTQLFKSFMNSYINKWIDAANQQRVSLEEIEKQMHQLRSSEVTTITPRLKQIILFHQEVEDVFKEMKQD